MAHPKTVNDIPRISSARAALNLLETPPPQGTYPFPLPDDLTDP